MVRNLHLALQKLQESSLEKCSSILRPLYDLLEVPQVRYAIDITAPYVGATVLQSSSCLTSLFVLQIAQVEVLRDYELETIVFRVPPAVVRCKHDAEIVAQRDWVCFTLCTH